MHNIFANNSNGRHWHICILSLALTTAAPAFAGSDNERPSGDWDVTLGAGAGIAPDYEGSDRYSVFPVPFVRITWCETVSIGSTGLDLRRKTGDFSYGVGLTYNSGRKEDGSNLFSSSNDDRLRGLGDIDPALGVRVFGLYDFQLMILSASVVKFTGSENDGLLLNVGISVPYKINKKWRVTPGINITWADSNYMETFFGVNSLQASRSRFSQFKAESGGKDASAGINVTYLAGAHWSVSGDLRVKQLLRSAADSPISAADTSASFMTTIKYRF